MDTSLNRSAGTDGLHYTERFHCSWGSYFLTLVFRRVEPEFTTHVEAAECFQVNNLYHFNLGSMRKWYDMIWYIISVLVFVSNHT